MVFDAGAADRHPRDHRRRSRFRRRPLHGRRPGRLWHGPGGLWKGDREELGHLVGPDVTAAVRERDRRARGGRPCPRQPAGQYRAGDDRRGPARRQGGRDRGPLPRLSSPRSPATPTAMSSPARSSDAVETNDIWTFRRDLKSRDPELAARRDRRSRLSPALSYSGRRRVMAGAMRARLLPSLRPLGGAPLGPDVFRPWEAETS